MEFVRRFERQRRRISLLTATTVALLGIAQAAAAAVPAEIAARLGNDLTPTGAERGANADGSIPAWTGGLTDPPAGLGYQPGMHHPDPFEGEAPLFTITPANMADHADKMTGTTKALMQRYKDTYFMKVYPTHRTCAGPESAYAAIKQNALTGELAEGGNGINQRDPQQALSHSQQCARDHLESHDAAVDLQGDTAVCGSRSDQ
ncbi:DUF1329 domain-containing protein [Parvibaculum sp.]|jgi:hypothetical protein|uniref:DUF1329 domain-containing protein n=2 Tax=Parvibaculum sp. TaxID=2024848 RepID=UPI002FDAEBDD